MLHDPGEVFNGPAGDFGRMKHPAVPTGRHHHLDPASPSQVADADRIPADPHRCHIHQRIPAEPFEGRQLLESGGAVVEHEHRTRHPPLGYLVSHRGREIGLVPERQALSGPGNPIVPACFLKAPDEPRGKRAPAVVPGGSIGHEQVAREVLVHERDPDRVGIDVSGHRDHPASGFSLAEGGGWEKQEQQDGSSDVRHADRPSRRMQTRRLYQCVTADDGD